MRIHNILTAVIFFIGGWFGMKICWMKNIFFECRRLTNDMPFNVWLSSNTCMYKLKNMSADLVYTNLYALMWALIENMPIRNMDCTKIITYLLTRCGSSHSNIYWCFIWYLAGDISNFWSLGVNLDRFSNKLKKRNWVKSGLLNGLNIHCNVDI